MMTDSLQRRTSDTPPSLDIQQMIAAENDPKQRASLLVLHAISLALEANTEAVRATQAEIRAHVERFETHATTEQTLINQGKGAWKVMAYVMTGAQIIGLWAWNDVRAGWKEVRTELTAVILDQQMGRSSVTDLKARVNTLEQRK